MWECVGECVGSVWECVGECRECVGREGREGVCGERVGVRREEGEGKR